MRLKAILAGAGLTLAGVTAAAAQGVATYGDFIVRCVPDRGAVPCEMIQERGNPNTGQRLVALSITFLAAENRYILVVALPLGVALEKGVVIATNSFTTPTMPFRRCDQGGCYVEAAVDKPLIDAFMGASGEGKLQVFADGEEKPRELPLSFNGFSSAHNDMVAKNRAARPAAPASAPAAP